MTNLAQTPLHDWHASHGGRMVDFAGWSMPVQYGSIVEEHQATRNAVGLFDISHMGRLRFDGTGAGDYLNSIVTRDIAPMQLGEIGYALVTNEQGGILDDVLVYRLADAAGQSYWLMVCNASNREKIVAWLNAHPPDDSVLWSDVTKDWAMLAVQGPRALEIAQPLVQSRLADLKYYSGEETLISGHGGIVSRTGYTGEDGVELIVGSNVVEDVWKTLLDLGEEAGARPAGLGARDTLRLEAAMPLYGHELSEDIDPFQAGLRFAVQLEGHDFPGRQALLQSKEQGSPLKRVGLELEGKRVPREHFPITLAGETIGEVTSGTFSPTLEKPIAMGYVQKQHAQPGTELEIDIRGRGTPARVVKLPFYRRAKGT